MDVAIAASCIVGVVEGIYESVLVVPLYLRCVRGRGINCGLYCRGVINKNILKLRLDEDSWVSWRKKRKGKRERRGERESVCVCVREREREGGVRG